MKKRQQTLKVKTKTKQNKTKKPNKLMNILRHNKNLLTVAEWLQQTQSKSCISKICRKLLANVIEVVNMPLISSVYFKGSTNFYR